MEINQFSSIYKTSNLYKTNKYHRLSFAVFSFFRQNLTHKFYIDTELDTSNICSNTPTTDYN